MARGDELFAQIECSFVRSPEYLELPVGARMLYLSIWCFALSQRRQIIRRPSNHYLATLAGLSRHPIATYLQRLHDSKLLICNGDTINVKGLHKKHKKFKFKDVTNGDERGLDEIICPRAEAEADREGEGKKIKGIGNMNSEDDYPCVDFAFFNIDSKTEDYIVSKYSKWQIETTERIVKARIKDQEYKVDEKGKPKAVKNRAGLFLECLKGKWWEEK